MRTFVAIMIAFMMVISTVACEKLDLGSKPQKDPPQVSPGRYTIHVSPHPSKETLLLDSPTGRTWMLSHDKGEAKWVTVNGGPDIDPLGIRGEGSKRFKILSVQEPDGKIIRYDSQGNRLPDDPKK